MRDPGLVQRAERAANALERAWGQWRSQHGLGAPPPTPVSSYVGYSLEEPWGQPRVVFGVAAEEAEMLASLLDGHDCSVPVHAELADWRLSAGNKPAMPPSPSDQRVAVPAQASSPVESAPSADVTADREPVAKEPAQRDADEHGPAEDEAVRTEQLARPAIVAFGDRPEHEAVPLEVVPTEDLEPLPPAEADGAEFDSPTQALGYYGPRYQGYPPQYQADGEARYDAAAADSDGDVAGSAADQPIPGVPTLVARLSRSRRSQRGAHEAGSWPHEQEHQQAAADTAV